MRSILCIVILIFSYPGLAQESEKDFALLAAQAKIEVRTSEKKERGIFRIYQNHISEQILNDCIYEHSCSNFSEGAIRHFGIIKGTFLTADRLMRCNRASALYIAPVRFNNDNKIKDHWESYTFKH